VYQRRLEKSALALLAVRRALAAHRLLARRADGFLHLLEAVSSADPQHFTQVWSDPVSYFWVRRAVHFLAGCRGEPMGTVERAYCAEVGAQDPAEALEVHLEEFKRFALAIALVSGSNIAFAEPYAVALPLAIPGTDLIITGGRRAAITGVFEGVIQSINPPCQIAIGDTARDGIRMERCPTVSVGHNRVFLNPARFRLPGIGFPIDWTEGPLEFQSKHLPTVVEALEAIRSLQPATFAHMEQALHTIALRPSDGTVFNVSASEMPGAFVCTVPSDAYALAGVFIHEFHHNTLFAIEESGAFFEPSERDQLEGENHYSPWVETLRPLHGILHAVYVFLPVFHFWHAVLDDSPLDDVRLAYAREQMARIPVQLRIGVNQLRRHARFTEVGSTLFEEMAKGAAATEQAARAIGATLHSAVMGISPSGALRPVHRDGRTLTVGEAMLEHMTKTDVNGECTEERAALEREISTAKPIRLPAPSA
jgi:HEXXH motif-containing protein